MKNNDLKKLLQQVVSSPQENTSKICIVRAVDIDNSVITVEPITSPDYNETTGTEDNYIYQVKLSAFQPQEVDTFGYLIEPKIGSYVVISPIENFKWYVSMFSQVESFQVFNENSNALKINTGSTVMQSDMLILGDINGDRTISVDKEESRIDIIGTEDTEIKIDNGKGLFIIDTDGLVGLYTENASVNVDNDNINLYNDYINFSITQKIAMKSFTKSFKKDILDKLQSILTSLDAGLTGLGGVDPLRTADIAMLLVTIPLLFED